MAVTRVVFYFILKPTGAQREVNHKWLYLMGCVMTNLRSTDSKLFQVQRPSTVSTTLILINAKDVVSGSNSWKAGKEKCFAVDAVGLHVQSEGCCDVCFGSSFVE